MKNKHYCLHAHFDLPARENPWLETEDSDPSAAPFPTERERAYQTCHGPNTASPLIGGDGRIVEFLNNYSHLSFSFNPEVLDYLERRHPASYQRVLEADRYALAAHGHGAALAVPYPPVLLDRLPRFEKRAALAWGIKDFTRRFGRAPEGLWLDMGADDETLSLAAEQGLRFVVLPNPYAGAVRPLGGGENDWLECAPETMDAMRPYLWRSGSHTLALFFTRPDLDPEKIYSRLPYALASDKPLESVREQVFEVGRRLANRLIDAFTVNDAAELSHAACSGELFGFKRHGGHRALSYALAAMTQDAPAEASNYGKFLDLFPPPEEVRLAPAPPRFTQEWQKPFLEALEHLSAELAAHYRVGASRLVEDVDAARDLLGEGLFLRDQASVRAFVDRACKAHPTPEEGRRLMSLFEIERLRMRMLSKWLLSGSHALAAEPLQALRFAARAAELAGVDESTENEFLRVLESLTGESGVYPNAAHAYKVLSKGERLDPDSLLAHFAVRDHLMTGPVPHGDLSGAADGVFEARVDAVCRRVRRSGRRMHALSVLRLRVRRLRTHERWEGFAVVYQGAGSDLSCWTQVGPAGDANERSSHFDGLFLFSLPEVFLDEVERIFGKPPLGLDSLFPDSRAKALARLIPRGETRRRRFLLDWHGLLRRFRGDPALAEEVAQAVHEATNSLGIPADALPGVTAFREAVREAAREFARLPSTETLDRLTVLLDGSGQSNLHLNLWELQENAWRGLRAFPQATEEDRALAAWLAQTLGLDETTAQPQTPQEA